MESRSFVRIESPALEHKIVAAPNEYRLYKSNCEVPIFSLLQVARTRARFYHPIAVLREKVVQLFGGHTRIRRTSFINSIQYISKICK